MALRLNKVYLAGNLTRDPEVRFLANERAVAKFGIASNRKFRSGDGEMREEVCFSEIEAWGRTAELVGQYLAKGSGVLVEGRLAQDTWEDKETGQKRSKTKIVADNVQFTDSKGEGGGYSQSQPQQQQQSRPSVPPPVDAGIDDDLPF